MPSPTRRLIAVVSAALTLSATAVVIFVPDHLAAGGDDAGSLPSVAQIAPDPTLDPRIVHLELRGLGWTRAVERLDSAIFERNETTRERTRTGALLDSLRGDRTEVRGALRVATTETSALEDELVAVDAVLRARAIDLFVRLGDDDHLEALDSVTAESDQIRTRELAREVTEVNIGQRLVLAEQLDGLGAQIDALEGRARELAVQIDATEAALAELDVRLVQLEAEVPAARDAVVAARRRASIAGLDISVVALDAYLGAERLLSADRPSCNIEWWMIAGVARIESRHGTIGGRTLRADGRPTVAIMGIPLDGRPGVREILDTDDGRLDGDTVHDRAVGPLQFIPETWTRRGRDGDGDGWSDPQNIYDAAYSTGRYLCALGGDVSRRSALRSAYFGYNTSSDYVDAVHDHALRYAGFEFPAVEKSVENLGPAGD